METGLCSGLNKLGVSLTYFLHNNGMSGIGSPGWVWQLWDIQAPPLFSSIIRSAGSYKLPHGHNVAAGAAGSTAAVPEKKEG